MKTRDKIFIGGLGALTPIFMNLLVVDFDSVFKQISLATVISYGIRVIILFYLGGLVAYLHKDEKNKLKLFEFGIIAPALITAMLNGTDPNKKDQGPGLGNSSYIIFDEMHTGHIQPVNNNDLGKTNFVTSNYMYQQVAVKKIEFPSESFFKKIERGLTGWSSRNQKVWFVIVSSHLDLESAKNQATQLNSKYKGFHADVYEPYKNDPRYLVAIGAYMTYSEAKFLRDKAVNSGLPGSTYIKTW